MSLHAWCDFNAGLKSIDPQDVIQFEYTVEAVVLETPVELADPPLTQARAGSFYSEA